MSEHACAATCDAAGRDAVHRRRLARSRVALGAKAAELLPQMRDRLAEVHLQTREKRGLIPDYIKTSEIQRS